MVLYGIFISSRSSAILDYFNSMLPHVNADDHSIGFLRQFNGMHVYS